MQDHDFSLVDVTVSHVDDVHQKHCAVEVAGALAGVGVKTLDLGALVNPARFHLAHSLGLNFPQLSVMAHCSLDRSHITFTYEALKTSPHARLGLTVPTMHDTIRSNRSESYTRMLLRAADRIAYANRLGLKAEIILEDASHTDAIFLARVARQLVDAGADGITLVESGHLGVAAFADLVKRVVRAVPGNRVGVRCSNQQGLAAGLTVAALEAGASEVGTVVTEWAADLPCPSLYQLSEMGVLPLAASDLLSLAARVDAMLGSGGHAQARAAAGEQA